MPDGFSNGLQREVGRLADGIEDAIEGLADRGEVLCGVVDDVVGAERAGEFEMAEPRTTAVTAAPLALANCTAEVPMAPEAP